MPYTTTHKSQVRQQIVENARILFNLHGFTEVSIDQIMQSVGLTRGGFYNHFRNKDELYAEAVRSFLSGRGKEWRDEAGVKAEGGGPETFLAMINSYLSSEHLGDLEGQCPMIALPSDVARASPEVRQAYKELLGAMIWLFENNISQESGSVRSNAVVLAALCVGGMVLSRTIDDEAFSDEVLAATKQFAIEVAQLNIGQ